VSAIDPTPIRRDRPSVSQVVAQLVSVNVGQPREISWQGQTVFTGIWKEPVDGPRTVRRLNVDGDGQGDRQGHGGEQRAVFVYQLESYRYWQDQLHRDDFTFGQFGENFTVEGLGDDDVHIGDRYRIGSTLVEVTQPRVTCYRVGIRMDEPRMPALLVAHGRPGFYLRVLEEGVVQAGDDVVHIATGPEAMTVAELNALLYLAGHHDVDQLRRALRIPALSPGWQASLRALLDEALEGSAGGGNAGLAAQGPPPAWRGYRTLRVAAKRSETRDVVSLELETNDGQALPPVRAGQSIALKLGTAEGSSPIVRTYSLSGSPGDARYRIGVKVESHGAAGQYISATVHVGDQVKVGAPRGLFVLDEGERPVVLVSAGIGVTPMLAMLHALHDRRSTRDIWWLHGARNRSEHAFAEEAASLLDDLERAHRRIWYSRPGPTDRAGTDYDAVGRVTPEALEAEHVPLDGEYYLCGPSAFMHTLRDGLVGLGISAGRVHTEIFGAHEPLMPGVVAGPTRTPHHPDGAPGTGPLVTFVRSGLDVRWDTANASLLELAEACDVPVRWSCRTGVCHTCETGLVDGTVEYFPEPLDPPADGNLLVCCARPDSHIAIDL
jgi:ferredoxin-NADP reductase/MOSC domain-containing protein YiiM